MAAMNVLIFYIVVFVNPVKDNIIICPPTYGMYEVSANINDVAIKQVRHCWMIFSLTLCILKIL